MDPFFFVALLFATTLGAVVGSFLNVCIWRLPRPGISVSRPGRSHCPSCGVAIQWYDNVPILSWLRLGGRCRSCHGVISIRYLFVEALTALFFALVAVRTLGASEPLWPEFVVLSLLVSSLIVASFIDIDLRILPDEITLGGMTLVPIVALLVPGLHTSPPDSLVWKGLASSQAALADAPAAVPELLRSTLAWPIGIVLVALGGAGGLYGFRLYWRLVHPDVANRLRDGLLAAVLFGIALPALWAVVLRPSLALHPSIVSLASAFTGMAVGAGIVLVVGIVGSAIFRKDAMGFGDVKLMGLLGGVTGWAGVLGGFAIACLLGSVVGVWRMVVYKTRYLWFGPFLSLGCLLVILFPEGLGALFGWYLDLFR